MLIRPMSERVPETAHLQAALNLQAELNRLRRTARGALTVAGVALLTALVTLLSSLGTPAEIVVSATESFGNVVTTRIEPGRIHMSERTSTGATRGLLCGLNTGLFEPCEYVRF